MKELQVGEKKWSIQLGDCMVYEIDKDSGYPIRCKNTHGSDDSYTIDGKRHINDSNPSLFESNPFKRSVDTNETIEPKLGCVENKAELINALVNIYQECSNTELKKISETKLQKLLESI